ncbi:MAG: AsmA-like C-terminal region-containing protein [Bacteroidota bacterium]
MQRWKKILIILGSIVLFLFTTAWILATVYEEQIKNLIITNINSRLKTPVHVKDIQFSFIRRFPSATLEFTDIMAEGTTYKELKKPLLSAHKLNLNFSLWDVFNDKASIKRIEITGGSSFIYIMRNGETNYDVWQSSAEKKNSTAIDLSEVVMKDVKILYRNDITSDDYSMQVENATASGIFSSDQYDLSVKSDMMVENFISGKVNYLYNKQVSLDLVTHVNTATKLYQLKKAQLTIADLVLNAEGTVQTVEAGNMIALNIQSADAGLKELLSIVPKEYIKDLDDYKFDGNVNFKTSISGLYGKSATPLIKAEFSTANASVKPKDSEHRLSKISLKGTYINKKEKSAPVSYLSFTNVNAMLDNQHISGELLMENLSDPWISLKAIGNLDLPTASSFYKPDTISTISGQLLVNMQFKGKASTASTYQSAGTIAMKDVAFTLKGKSAEFSDFNGLFTMDGNKITINDLRGKASGSDFTLNGNINNLISFLIQPDQVLTGNAQLSSRNLDLNELLEDKGQSTSRDTAYYLDINKNFNFLMQLNLGNVTFRKFQAWNLKGDIAVRNKAVSSNGISFKSMSGGWKVSGTINASHNDSILISCNADVKGIDINELFADMGNFGQDVITSKNLRGKLTADIVFAGMWSKTLNCNTDKISVQSKITIEQGELIQFQPMMALAKYIKGADLQDIKFSTLTNNIDIHQRKIYIPAMDIHSSALELTASGTHSFDNIIDYRIQLLLSQLTGKKVKQMNTEFGTVEDDGLGRTKIFLTMVGPAGNPKIKYDSKGVEEKIVQDVQKEKGNLKTILNKEFGWFKKDSVINTKSDPQKKKKEELQIERED